MYLVLLPTEIGDTQNFSQIVLVLISNHIQQQSSMDEIIMATHNPHKVDELKKILPKFNLLSLKELQFRQPIEETGQTLFENALLKVKAVYQATGRPCMADDTGLEVRALRGAPGVYSARYAGINASASQNVSKLLRELEAADDRTACFRTVIAYMNEYGQYRFFEGCVDGRITETPRGESGFGYDPVFQPEGYSQTFAEMTDELKNQISHRQNALAEFRKYFEFQQAV